jgi:hypothetical protein
VPVSNDARIKVSLLPPTDPPTGPGSAQGVLVAEGIRARYTQKNDEAPAEGDTQDGKLEWICVVQAGATVDLNLAWEVSAPVGLHWVKQ